MSLLPFGTIGGLSPFNSLSSMMDPWAGMEMMPWTFERSLDRPFRRMERELGKLLSSVKEDDKSFQVCVDVSHFNPNEIQVKTTDKDIIVHGKHEERDDTYGTVSREFRRRVSIPRGVNPESVTSTISPNGVLTIVAPKLMVEGSSERVIPITMAPSSRQTPVEPRSP